MKILPPLSHTHRTPVVKAGGRWPSIFLAITGALAPTPAMPQITITPAQPPDIYNAMICAIGNEYNPEKPVVQDYLVKNSETNALLKLFKAEELPPKGSNWPWYPFLTQLPDFAVCVLKNAEGKYFQMVTPKNSLPTNPLPHENKLRTES